MDSILIGYPSGWGRQRHIVMDHRGPSGYRVGGEFLSAMAYGLGGFDFATLPVPAVTRSGNYSLAVRFSGNTVGLACPSVALQWYAVATGLEVANGVNLSAEIIRVQLVGQVVL